jgi:hypothetical protein
MAQLDIVGYNRAEKQKNPAAGRRNQPASKLHAYDIGVAALFFLGRARRYRSIWKNPMSENTILNVRMTAFHTINPARPSQDSESPAFKSETVSQARAARDCAPIHTGFPTFPAPAAGSAVQLARTGDAGGTGNPGNAGNTGNAGNASNANVVLRHAPLRPARGHIVDMPMFMQWGSNDSLNSRASLSSEGYHSASDLSVASSISSSNDSLADAASIASNRPRVTSEARITLTDARPGPVVADRALPHPVVSEVKINLVDGALSHAESERSLAPPAPNDAAMTAIRESGKPASHAPTLARAPAVRIALDGLLAEFTAPTTSGTDGVQTSSLADPIEQIAEASRLYQLGSQVYRAIFEQGSDWPERAGSAIALVAAKLEGASKDNIDIAFVQLGLGHAIDNAGTPNALDPASGGNHPATASAAAAVADTTTRTDTTTRLAVLDSVRQLRFHDNVQRQRFEAALYSALEASATPIEPSVTSMEPPATPKVRRIAEGIADVAVEMADEAFTRQVAGTLLAASEQNDIAAIHTAFQHWYNLDRSFAQPYEAGADRCLAFVQGLPQSIQRQFMDVFVQPGQKLDGKVSKPGLHAYLGAIRSQRPPAHHLSDGLRQDQERFMMDLFGAAALLRGEQSDAMRQAPRTPAGIQVIPLGVPPSTPWSRLRAIAHDIRNYFRPSALDRARREIDRLLKPKASSKPQDRQAPQTYADAALAYVGTLSSPKRAVLDRMIQNFVYTDRNDPEFQRIQTIDAALRKDWKLRAYFIPAVHDAIGMLQGNPPTRDLYANALDQLMDAIDSADDPAEAQLLIDLAARRLSLSQQDMQAALVRIQHLEERIKRDGDIEFSASSGMISSAPADGAAAFQGRQYTEARNETLRFIPPLRNLAATLQLQAI